MPQPTDEECASPEYQQEQADSVTEKAAAEELEAQPLRLLVKDDADTQAMRRLAALAARFVAPGAERETEEAGESPENAPKPSPS